MKGGQKPKSAIIDPLDDRKGRMVKAVEALRKGAYRNSAAAAGGFAYETFRQWFRAGEAAILARENGEELTPEREMFATFAQDVMIAEGQIENERIARIDKHARSGAPDSWRADAWMLEHGPSKPRWAGRSEVTGADGEEIKVKDVSLSPEEIEQRVADIVARAAKRV